MFYLDKDMHGLNTEFKGLYRPEFEHDACGIGFICDKHNNPRHDIVIDGAEILNNLEHRGAAGANPTTGDGAGLLLHIPHDLFVEETDFELPPQGEYGVAFCFLPQDEELRKGCQQVIEKEVEDAYLEILGWRDVPVNSSILNEVVKACEPVMRQLFVKMPDNDTDDRDESFEVRMYLARRYIARDVLKKLPKLKTDPVGYYITSFSNHTIVYKGMFLANQVTEYYPDLTDTRTKSALALVHQRFSTNTFPSWKLAHPYRMVAHNGEINTVRGNINNMLSRQHSVIGKGFGERLRKIFPLLKDGLSDSGTFDNCLDLLTAAGYSISHAVAMMIPEAWQAHDEMDEEKKYFYRHQATMMEPWDGPALISFTDGKQIGAVLDRNGLRPARYIETKDGRVVMASEVGVITVPDEEIVHKWRLEPGRMLLIDLEEGRIISDVELKQQLASEAPYKDWVEKYQIPLAKLESLDKNPDTPKEPDSERLLKLQLAFGFDQEDLKFILDPMVVDGQEPVGSMGDDSPQAVLSDVPHQLPAYFRQEFAQVTNPAIDPIREELVMGTNQYLGHRPNLFDINQEPTKKIFALDTPVLSEEDLVRISNAEKLTDGNIKSSRLSITIDANDSDTDAAAKALEKLCKDAEKLVEQEGTDVIVLSDREVDENNLGLPALLALSAVHQHLVATGLRNEVGLVIDSASIREVHDFAVFIGFGAEAICPYLAYWTITRLKLRDTKCEPDQRLINYRAAVRKGLHKVMSKMGVSTIQSFCGAQLFEAVGLNTEFIDKYFCRAISQIEGIGLKEVIQDVNHLHNRAYGKGQLERLDHGGQYAWREEGEQHLWTPASISKLQHAVRSESYSTYKEYAQLINDQSKKHKTLRGLLEFKFADNEVPLDEVEPASDIVKRFSTGAMSLGAISWEAHTTLAIAMNRIGGKSNTGEGGEEADRYIPMENGDSMRSSIKQVASGRFGVTAEYLANSDMMQIKIAQGAKPGEGGQLPGHKVDEHIARVRHSVPGVGLISPPPHHDIYSIEDIAQLIHDLKNCNPAGDVSVKLVSRYGVGTVAAGVAKAKSDHITIAGHDGGTGASPLSSIKRAGTPWELGLSETHQTLVLNDLRGRIALQVDGQIKTGRDVVIGAILGADEFAFATAPLVAEGCIMMRKCHLNTCPVGVATQDPVLRKKFAGKPEHVVNYFFYIAEEVRELMAKLGFRSLNEIIGRCDLLEFDPEVANDRAKQLDFAPVLAVPDMPDSVARFNCQRQEHGLEKALDNKLIDKARPAINDGKKVSIETPVYNSNRTFGTIMSGEIAKLHGHKGLPDDTLTITATGNAGQSFGCFLARGITLNLIGDANDYCGKGLSGGILAVKPPETDRVDGDNIITGNVNLYGAISGEAYFRGVAGERFCVRNSGATAVLEGAGDHCCEYMTGGMVIVLGSVGRNFAAGMSGGVAFVYDPDNKLEKLCNMQMVALEKPTDEVGIYSHAGRSDYDLLEAYITNHHERTNSGKAKSILDNFEKERANFIKVMPHEYRRALGEIAQKKTGCLNR